MSRSGGAFVETVYRPRAVAALGRWRAGGADVKAYGIRAGEAPLAADLIEDARVLLGRSGPDEASFGFAILHRGEEAVWLLLHGWLPGGILTERLWRRSLDGVEGFEPADRPLMACVRELAVIGFERDAYVATVMAGDPPERYLGRLRPDGTC